MKCNYKPMDSTDDLITNLLDDQLDFPSLKELELEDMPELPKMPATATKADAKKKCGRKKRKTAEEKAVKVRARNRRAQQAFRQRQKALSQEKDESMASLQEEINELRQTNRELQLTIDELRQKLELQSGMAKEYQEEQLDDVLPLLIDANTPGAELAAGPDLVFNFSEPNFHCCQCSKGRLQNGFALEQPVEQTLQFHH